MDGWMEDNRLTSCVGHCSSGTGVSSVQLILMDSCSMFIISRILLLSRQSSEEKTLYGFEM